MTCVAAKTLRLELERSQVEVHYWVSKEPFEDHVGIEGDVYDLSLQDANVLGAELQRFVQWSVSKAGRDQIQRERAKLRRKERR